MASMVSRRDAEGSSPLARGLPSIPLAVARALMDHPRSRGVYGNDFSNVIFGFGSSPLARGLRGPGEAPGPPSRIIPARAGFTRRAPRRRRGRRDHPRSRGVYQARGDAGGLAPGIIPARAGFTGWSGGRSRPPGDHPRSRGVYICLFHWRRMIAGSSPLARGLQGSGAAGPAALRIIPARAGFTGLWSSSPPSEEDHPRSRGVYARTRSARVRRAGSSPLARGLHVDVRPVHWDPGIIPARAGFTRPRSPGW